MSFDANRIRSNSANNAPINEAPSPNIPVVDMSLADDETLAQMSLMPSADLGLDKNLKPVFNRLMAQRQLRINGDEFADLFKTEAVKNVTLAEEEESGSVPVVGQQVDQEAVGGEDLAIEAKLDGQVLLKSLNDIMEDLKELMNQGLESPEDCELAVAALKLDLKRFEKHIAYANYLPLDESKLALKLGDIGIAWNKTIHHDLLKETHALGNCSMDIPEHTRELLDDVQDNLQGLMILRP